MFGEDALSATTSAARPGPHSDAPPTRSRICSKAVALEGRDWVHGRAHLELGKLSLKNGNRPVARRISRRRPDSALPTTILPPQKKRGGF